MKEIICKNEQGDTIEFTYNSSPVRLLETSGFASADYTVNTTQNSGQDGETYNGSTANKRNIIITAEIYDDYKKQRDKLYSFFQPRSFGTVYYYDENKGRKAGYYVEKVEIEEAGIIRTTTISLICPDPKFYALEDDITSLAVWEGCIEFPLELSEPFEVTKKINTLIGNVTNNSYVTQGLTIRFTATGTVVNPSLYDVNRHNKMQINITMHSGDVIIVTTADGNKRVKLTSGGITKNINNLMAYPPVWLKAYQGDNLFRYDADSGIDNLSVSIKHTEAYWGA